MRVVLDRYYFVLRDRFAEAKAQNILVFGIDSAVRHTPKVPLSEEADVFEEAALTQFANSLTARMRADRGEHTVGFGPPPGGRTNDDLHAAALAQHDKIETLSSRFDAELKIMVASLDRLERDNAVLRGRIDQLIDYDKSRRAEFQRALKDAEDVVDACVDRLLKSSLFCQTDKA